MLTHLLVCDFTLVQHQELFFEKGLTVLTGETGAGKSILLDALGFALGARADASKVRQGAEQAEVCASFEIQHLARVQQWLAEADLGQDECIVRRIATKEGRTRAHVNGRPVTQTQLRVLAQLLVDIHSQHEHQALMSATEHRKLLDAYGQHEALAQAVRTAFKHWQDIHSQLEQVQRNSDELNARFQLLRYQAQELDQLALEPGELQTLEEKQQRLANAEQVQLSCQQGAEACIGIDESISAQLHRVLSLIDKLPHTSDRVLNAKTMLLEAKIQVEEAGRELEYEATNCEDDSDLQHVEDRLSAIYEIARKHRISPEGLVELHQTVLQELAGLRSGDDAIQILEHQLQAAQQDYAQAAQKLTQARTKAERKLSKEVNSHLCDLAMANATFSIDFTEQSLPSPYGNEAVEFLISTVPGLPPQPLAKVASGGELSRISLAIQVVTAKTAVTPTLVFDEVDVGIGGATGDVVGRLLRKLSHDAQILCVTHLAQVASKAHHHFTVEKVIHKKSATTAIAHLKEEDRVLEVARMMGGAIDSEQSLAHAREMLEAV